MSEKIILCSECGSKNRISSDNANKAAICGSCGASLQIKNNSGETSGFLSLIVNLWWVWLLIFVLFVLPYFDESSPPTNVSSNIQKVDEKTDIILDSGTLLIADGRKIAPISMDHGVLSQNFSSGLAPFEIKTSYSNNYYIKIVNSNTGQTAITAFLVGGRPFEVNMPLGTYELKYAAGNNWYGTEKYFGPRTSFSKTNELFHFTSNGYSYSGYTVELILQAHGNLRTLDINESDF